MERASFQERIEDLEKKLYSDDMDFDNLSPFILNEINELLAIEPENLTLLQDKANYYIFKKDYENGAKVCEYILTKHPNDETTEINLDFCKTMLDNNDLMSNKYDPQTDIIGKIPITALIGIKIIIIAVILSINF